MTNKVLTAEEIAAKQEKVLAKKREEIAAKYPHALVETLSFHEEMNKFATFIRCTECGNEDREVFTSDLFQVKTCEACSKKAKVAAKAAKKAELAAARELVKAGAVVQA